MSADAGRFRVFIDDDFRIDIAATKLDREGVSRLLEWLQVNKDLAPPPHQDDTDAGRRVAEGGGA